MSFSNSRLLTLYARPSFKFSTYGSNSSVALHTHTLNPHLFMLTHVCNYTHTLIPEAPHAGMAPVSQTGGSCCVISPHNHFQDLAGPTPTGGWWSSTWLSLCAEQAVLKSSPYQSFRGDNFSLGTWTKLKGRQRCLEAVMVMGGERGNWPTL